MKKILPAMLCLLLSVSLSIPVAAASQAETLAQQLETMRPALVALFAIAAVLAFLCVLFTVIYVVNSGKKTGKKRLTGLLVMLYVCTLLVFGCSAWCFLQFRSTEESYLEAQSTQATQPSSDTTQPTTQPETEATTEVPTEAPTEPEPTVNPAYTELSDPANWGIETEIIVDGQVVDSYQREESINFGKPEDYFPFDGVSSFRGNNFRNDAAFGTVNVESKSLEKIWSRNIGSLNDWPGSGWTGQPLVARWDEQTKQNMNLYPEKKAKEDLVEVIHATLDGNIYFYDLEDGSYTRDPLYLGMNFKGSGCLDPRGYPILYVGSGITYNGTVPKMYMVSLIDCSVLYSKGGYDSYAPRGWTAYDGTPLIDGNADTLIWPGENGIIYSFKLNTSYDAQAGTLTMTPDEPVRLKITTDDIRSGSRWAGFETSAVGIGKYMYLSDNTGMFYCIDLNTLEVVWAQDTKDDSNSSPVFRWEEDGNGYLYSAPSLHWSQSNSEGTISIYKINANTGEIVWEVPFSCHTIPDLSGGVQGSPVLGRKGTDLENMIFYPVARTDGFYDGNLVALDATTGEILWDHYMNAYAWSSPVGVYTEDGKGYLVMCDSTGNVILLDGKTGEVLDYVNLGSNIEASPIVYGDTIVIGTRGGLVCGIKIS